MNREDDYEGANESSREEELYTKAVRAGFRTYFFDVKATRGNDLFVTITESRKKIDALGGVKYEKNKIHLYKEDFEKFKEGLEEVVKYIDIANSGQPQSDNNE